MPVDTLRTLVSTTSRSNRYRRINSHTEMVTVMGTATERKKNQQMEGALSDIRGYCEFQVLPRTSRPIESYGHATFIRLLDQHSSNRITLICFSRPLTLSLSLLSFSRSYISEGKAR